MTRNSWPGAYRHPFGYVNDIDHGYADNLITVLAPFDVPNTDTLCELLAADKEFRWLEIFPIALAGERRVPAAIPSLVNRYGIDTDYLLECVTNSLARIGDAAAVRLVRSAFPNESWGFKNHSSAVLANIKHQESEDALLVFLECGADRWRAEREERQRRQAERKAELDEPARRYQAAKAAGFDPLARPEPTAKVAGKP